MKLCLHYMMCNKHVKPNPADTSVYEKSSFVLHTFDAKLELTAFQYKMSSNRDAGFIL